MSGVERLLEKAGYSEKEIEYYLRKVNVGSIENPSVKEAYTGPCARAHNNRRKISSNRLRGSFFIRISFNGND